MNVPIKVGNFVWFSEVSIIWRLPLWCLLLQTLFFAQRRARNASDTQLTLEWLLPKLKGPREGEKFLREKDVKLRGSCVGTSLIREMPLTEAIFFLSRLVYQQYLQSFWSFIMNISRVKLVSLKAQVYCFSRTQSNEVLTNGEDANGNYWAYK